MKGADTLKHAVAIRHVHFEDLGTLADALQAHGYGITYLDVGRDELTHLDALGPDLLVVLGGPIGAYEEASYPFIRDEMRLLEQRLQADVPTIGICLGAQLMARALGARVYPGAKREIGWAPLDLTQAGWCSPLEHLARPSTSVLHWHNDTFDCPAGATLLASTPVTRNQAFSWKSRCLGVQFHPELAAHGFERWLIGHACEINAGSDCSVARLRADTRRHASRLESQARRLWDAVLGSFTAASSAERARLSKSA